MYAHLIGKVVHIGADFIELNVNNIGFHLITPNPYDYKVDTIITVFTYQNVREDAIELYAFNSRDEKDLFIKLISVKGIGPKSACAILATGDISGVINAIENEDAVYLRKFPKIGPKAAQQIILDLRGKLTNVYQVKGNEKLEEAKQALSALGYSNKEINSISKELIKDDLSVDGYIKKALQLMLK